MRGPQMRRGFGNACRNVIPRKTGFELPGGDCFAPADHRPNDSRNRSAAPIRSMSFRDMRLPTSLAHLRKFILAAKYKGFCNAIIHGLQFRDRGRDLRQRCVVIENPCACHDRSAWRRCAGDAAFAKAITLVVDRSGFILEWIRSNPTRDSKPTGTRKGKTGAKGAHAAHHAPKWN
jgi:hypothetical protein